MRIQGRVESGQHKEVTTKSHSLLLDITSVQKMKTEVSFRSDWNRRPMVLLFNFFLNLVRLGVSVRLSQEEEKKKRKNFL